MCQSLSDTEEPEPPGIPCTSEGWRQHQQVPRNAHRDVERGLHSLLPSHTPNADSALGTCQGEPTLHKSRLKSPVGRVQIQAHYHPPPS